MSLSPIRTETGAERVDQHLRVGVYGDELDAVNARLDHAVDGVAPAAADADDLNSGEVVDEFIFTRIKHGAVSSSRSGC